MATNFKPKRFSFALSLVFLIAACNNPGSGVNKNSAGQGQANLTSGTLYKLYVDSSNFLDLDRTKKVVFAVIFAQGDDILVLHGWSSKGDIFRTTPDIQLNYYDTSKITFGNGMYLGNLILSKDDVKGIQDSIRKYKTPYVIFIPRVVDANHFGYSVNLTSDDPTDEVKKVTNTTQTGANLNPSPPKTY